MQKTYPKLQTDYHELDNRIVKLEESYIFIKDDLTTIKKNGDDMKESLGEIREKFMFHEGATTAKKTGWKVAGYVFTVFITLGAHHALLKYFGVHL